MTPIVVRLSLTLLLAVAGWAVFRQAWALETFRQSPNLVGLEEALRWDPRNADYHFHSAQIHRDDIEHRDLARARAHLQRALDLNPYNWRFWFEMGHTLELSGNLEEAEKAYGRALDLNPLSPVYRWRKANFLIRVGRIEESITHFEAAVSRDRDYALPSLMLLSRLGVSAERIAEFWPTTQRLRLEFFRFLTRDDLPEGFVSSDRIEEEWRRLIDGDPPLDFREGRFFTSLLFDRHRFAEARHRWIELAERNGYHDPNFAAGSNLIWQGSFEGEFLGRPLGWVIRSWDNSDYSIRLERPADRNRSRTVRFDFKGTENLELRELDQQVVVEPATHYRFSFEARSDGISTEQGPYFNVFDVGLGRTVLRTERILGTTPWSRYEGEFQTGPETRLIRLLLRRDLSRRIDNTLRGTLWIDSVRLEPAAQ